MKNLVKNYKTAVIGAGGQVGCSLKEIKKNNIIYFSKKDINISNQNNLNLLSKHNIDIIINLAAITDLTYIEKNKNFAFKNNVGGVAKLINYCKKNRIFLIHISSDYIYKDSNFEKKENHPKKYYNYYGYTKYMAEKIIKERLNNYVIIRTSNIFSEKNNNIISKILYKIKNNNKLFFYNNIFFNPTSARSLSYLLIKILKYVKKNNLKYKGIYNYAQFPVTTPYLFAKYLLNNLKYKNSVKIYQTEYNIKEFIKRPLNSSMNIDKINDLLHLRKTYWKKDIVRIIKNNDEI